MSGDYHYDAAWERILDLQREAENRRQFASARPSSASVAFRSMAAWAGTSFVRIGSAMSRWAQPAGEDGQPEVG